VDDLLDDSGTVDPARAQAAVEAVLAAHPHWRKNLWGSTDVTQGVRGGNLQSSRS
jgi:hypothetical protein